MPPKSKKTSGRKSARSGKSTGDQNHLASGLTSLSILEQLDDEGLEALGRDYYVLLIRQLERQIGSYEAYIGQLTADYNALLEENVQVTVDKRETLRQLNAEFRDKIDQTSDLVYRICGRYAMYEVNQVKWKNREEELEQSKRQTEEEMLKENESLAAQLHSLEEFRTNREMLIQQYKELVAKWEQMKSEHAEALSNMMTRFTAYRARLKKATHRRLHEVATEFRQQSYDLTEPTYKRMLAENVSVKNQLVKLSTAVHQLSGENETILENFYHFISEQSRLENEQELIAVRTSATMKLVHLLKVHENELDQILVQERNKITAKEKLESECDGLQHEINQMDKLIAASFLFSGFFNIRRIFGIISFLNLLDVNC